MIEFFVLQANTPFVPHSVPIANFEQVNTDWVTSDAMETMTRTRNSCKAMQEFKLVTYLCTDCEKRNK